MASGTGQWQSNLAQEQAGIGPVVSKFRHYKKTLKQLEDTEQLLRDSQDAEMLAMVKQELEELKKRRDDLMQDLKVLLLPRDHSSEKSAIVEIRAGTGGEEAALFAADLYRMYSRYAQAKGWKTEIIDTSHADRGGFKEIIFEISGKNVFGRLKHERGVHRVQRVPATEAGGRIHTSTATVAVLPEVEEVEVNIKPDDLKTEFFAQRWPRRTKCQQGGYRRENHPHPHRDNGGLQGGEVSASKPHEGHGVAPLPPVRRRAAQAAR